MLYAPMYLPNQLLHRMLRLQPQPPKPIIHVSDIARALLQLSHQVVRRRINILGATDKQLHQ